MSKIILCLFVLSFFSCKPHSFEQVVKREVENYLDTVKISYEYVMLIPNSGCTGCISDAEYFFKEYSDKNEILFIFTHIVSKKNIRIRLGKENVRRENVLIDKNDNFYFEEYQESIYPIVAVIKNKKVVALKDHTFLREKYPPKE